MTNLICKVFGHAWGTFYKSSSGRKVCDRCNFVTEPPTLNPLIGVADVKKEKA